MKSLRKGLNIIEFINEVKTCTLPELVIHSGLPKSTAFRILENLRAAGYLSRDVETKRYELTIRVRRLSDGFDDNAWISHIAAPMLTATSRRFGFPLAIATLYGTSMVLRDTTDQDNPLIPLAYTRGTLIPLFSSGSGKVYLAFCAEALRDSLLEICAASDDPDHRIAREPAILQQIITRVRKQRYAFGAGSRKGDTNVSTTTIAIPLFADKLLLGCLAMRFIDAALSRDDVLRKFLAPMRKLSSQIGREGARVVGGS